MNNGYVRASRALISVSDKSGIGQVGRDLSANTTELISTGGTAQVLRDAGLRVLDVSVFTGYPECFDGRVKTLHPAIHGGLLYDRRNADHLARSIELRIQPIDLLIVNLYPFEDTVKKVGVTTEEAVENIDVGGPTMIRAAAKNHEHVAVVTRPSQYEAVMREIRETGGTTLETRRRLMVEAFGMTAAYDRAILEHFRSLRW